MSLRQPAAGSVVVVVLAGEQPRVHASQQLAWSPTHALPPGGAVHLPVPSSTLQRPVPWQQVTAPGLPHVERAAQRTTAPRQRGRSWPLRTARVATATTQWT